MHSANKTVSKLLCLAALALPLLAQPVEEVSLGTSQLVKRQYIFPDVADNCPYSKTVGEAKGQAYHHWQVTDNQSCGRGEEDDGCSVAKLEQHTFGITAGVSLAGSIGGLTADVTNEWTSGEQYECNAGVGETVCVWVKNANSIFDFSKADGCRNNVLVEGKVPNKDNWGGGYYCVRGEQFCRNKNANYWSDS